MLYSNENVVTPIKLDRGQGAMTEKKRIDLAKMVETGVITSEQAHPPSPGGGPAPGAGDPLEQLIKEATDLLAVLPAGRQRELAEVLNQLQQARLANDTRTIAGLVPRLAMLMVQIKA